MLWLNVLPLTEACDAARKHRNPITSGRALRCYAQLPTRIMAGMIFGRALHDQQPEQAH